MLDMRPLTVIKYTIENLLSKLTIVWMHKYIFIWIKLCLGLEIYGNDCDTWKQKQILF